MLVYQLELTLAEVEPRIWRRLRVADDVTLHSLHLTLQHAMGWTHSHLYEFEVGGRRFSEPHPPGSPPSRTPQCVRVDTDRFDPQSFDAEATTELLQHFHGKPRSRARRATNRCA